MIVVFTCCSNFFHTNETRRKESVRRAHRRRGRCRGEEKRLPLLREEANDGAHIVCELFTQQAVKLVEDEELYPYEAQFPHAAEL